MPEESQALAKFWWGYEQDGVSEDGLPRFRDQLMVTLAVPPYTVINREATEEDIDMYPGPYAMFQKQNATRDPAIEAKGFPLAMWPVISPAALNMLAARDIFTVEQLAGLAERGSAIAGAPGEIKELAERAKLMITMSSQIGQFEAIVRDLTGQRDVLNEQVTELRATIKAQDGMINSLKLKAA